MGVGRKQLEEAGFHVIKQYTPKWFEVLAPDKEHGAVLRQAGNAWHYFAKNHSATASGSSADRCHLDGLGTAIDTDGEIKTYSRLMQEGNIPSKLRKFEGVYAAMTQIYEATKK